MLSALDGWTVEETEHATRFDASIGTLWAWKRRAPIGRVTDADWTRIPRYRIDETTSRLAITTPSGTDAVIVSSRGMRDGTLATAVLATVIGLDDMVVIGGVSNGENLTAPVRALVATLAPESPVRRFLYPPPRGWHGEAKSASTVWYAPEFPRSRATITVSPAEPKPPDGKPEHVMQAIDEIDRRRGFVVERREGPEPIASRVGPRGSAWALVGVAPGVPRLWRDVVVLADDAFVYSFVLATLSREERDRSLPSLRELVLGARSHAPAELLLA